MDRRLRPNPSGKTPFFWEQWEQLERREPNPRTHWDSNSKSLDHPEQTCRCVCLQKNIGGVHNIFNDNTKNFLLDRDDIKQCLIALRTQSVSKEISDTVKVLMSSNGLQKWTEDQDRILLEKHLSSGNNWNEENLIPGRTGIQIKGRWKNLSKQVTVYVYKKTLAAYITSSLTIPKSSSWTEMIFRTQIVSKEILDAVTVLMSSKNGRRKWTEDEDRIILVKHLSSGNNWNEENLIPGRTGSQIQSRWTNRSKQVAVYVYKKNIGGVHNIFNDNTKKFLLDRDDIKQCLIALRTQSVSKEISDAVKVLMSNAKKRPPSSELGNATKKKKVATKN
jgi:hypothetical protein